jgi:Zn-dependent protease
MTGALKIATIRGIPIRVHYSFLLVLPFLAFLFGRHFVMAAHMADVPTSGLAGSPWLWGLGVALGLFLSVLVHELAHSFYALWKGGKVEDITLLMIGGVSRISEGPERPRQEAMMAFVGPLSSLALGAGFLGLHLLASPTATPNLRFAFFCLAQLNLVLGLFNLLPAFPMDGGRILRALLVGRMGALRATDVASKVGIGFAALFALAGLLTFNLLLLLVAYFVYVGAREERGQELAQSLLSQLHVGEVMTPSANMRENPVWSAITVGAMES